MLVSIRVIVILLAIAVVALLAICLVAAATKKKQPVPTADSNRSYFDGSTLQLIGYRLLTVFITGITLGIAFPWAVCMQLRWETKHTVINGRRLRFTGKGMQLIGGYLLWAFLTVFTLGIYSLWLGLNLKKWIVAHTVYEDDESDVESWFSGTIGQYLGTHLLAGLLTICTFGIGAAWAERRILEWEAKHTHIGGSPLVFSGTGGQLFVQYLLLGLLTPLTLGIYAIFFPVKYLRWKYSYTNAVYQTPEIQAQSKAHQAQAMQDYARFHLAANDTELSVMRSGITYEETPEKLEELAQAGNRYAMYRLSLIKRQESDFTAEQHWLKAAAEQNYHPAMLDYAKQLIDQNPVLAAEYLEGAARNGNCEAPWLLKCYFQQFDTPEALLLQAYWFKVALEWNDPKALEGRAEYEALVRHIACLLSETAEPPAKSGGLVIAAVLGIGVFFLLLIGFLAVFLFGYTFETRKEPARYDPVYNENTTLDDTISLEETTTLTSESGIGPDLLVGDWTGWCGSVQEAEGMQFTHCVHIQFSSDGTFTNYEMSHMIYADGSSAELVTRHTYGGDYRIDGNTLTLHYTFFNSGAPWDEGNEATTTHEIALVDGVLQINNLGYYDFRYDTLHRNATPVELVNGVAQEQQAITSSAILGTWRSACRDGNSIYTEYFTLNSDGSCSYFSQRFDHYNYVPLEGETGWYVPPTGWPDYRGTYTFDGETLTLQLVSDYEYEETITYHVLSADSDSLTIDNMYGTYLCQDMDVWALCDRLNVNTDAN